MNVQVRLEDTWVLPGMMKLKHLISLCQAISQSDVVLITGGVSMGDFDFVPSVLERAGVKLLFSRVNIQPGKPTTFGIHQEGTCIWPAW